MSKSPTVVERVDTDRGELVLRQDGGHYEVISNGTFLMDTRGGESERLLVSAAVAAHANPAAVLIGGLGVGFSATQALADERVKRVVVVEIEPALVDWHRSHLASYSAGALNDPRVTVVIADLVDHLTQSADRFDVICLDIDNGPDWTVTAANNEIYSASGTSLLVSHLTPGGMLSVWSAARAPSYETVLRDHFSQVTVHEVPVSRGEPDVVMLGSAPRDLSARGTQTAPP